MWLSDLKIPLKLPVQTVARNSGGKVDVLRLDLVHPIVSGNKWFKLKEHLRMAAANKRSGILTYGGAWSNHLAAVAYAAKLLHLPSVGIVRGEEPSSQRLSETLTDCRLHGMKLVFMDRSTYQKKDEPTEIAAVLHNFPNYHRIPEGAADEAGVHGAATIAHAMDGFNEYNHVCCAIGTGAMLAGLITASAEAQNVHGFSVFKDAKGIAAMVAPLLPPHIRPEKINIQEGYGFGGYGKTTPELVEFMNRFYTETGIPTDRVYSAKLFYGVMDLFNKDFFSPNANVLLVHCGGLQGNRSFPEGTLLF